jgi:quercetin 2,3-dioxygenase
MQRKKSITYIRQDHSSHWVGDGFPVQNVFGYDDLAEQMDPFLMLDYAGPYDFPPSHMQRGVGPHPHRGFETVTLMYSGEVTHRDSAGGGGSIGPGDVQWMTAGAGVIHEEMHSANFTQAGGRFEAIQLWVNLPASCKMTAPRYQDIPASQIPIVALPDGSGEVRVIAGACQGIRGPAHTFTTLDLWEVRTRAGTHTRIVQEAERPAALFLIRGEISLDGDSKLSGNPLIIFSEAQQELVFMTEADACLLYMSGDPIRQPVVGYGPFVMNTSDEIRQSMDDYKAGRFGMIPVISSS